MSERDPSELVVSLAEGYVNSRCLHVVAALGVCDVVGDDLRPVTDLARDVDADPRLLGRVMRHLASLGIFEMRDSAFRHNDASRLLTSGHRGGMLPLTRMLGLPIMWDSFKVLEDSVRTGRPGASSTSHAASFLSGCASRRVADLRRGHDRDDLPPDCANRSPLRLLPVCGYRRHRRWTGTSLASCPRPDEHGNGSCRPPTGARDF